MEQLSGLFVFIFLIVLGYISGRMIETKHYRSIKEREREFLNLPAVTMKRLLEERRGIARARLVAGNVVISVDYFKRFLAGLRNLFGGRMVSYETLIDRARREAILRMKEEAKGSDIILNMRIATSSISKGAKKRVGSIEALAYGTAITYRSGSTEPIQDQAAQTQTTPQPSQTAPRPLAQASYKVVFSGQVAPGVDVNSVKAKIAALYKVPVERCESMFSGRTVTIKDNLDQQAAQTYKTAFERTGAICQIVQN